LASAKVIPPGGEGKIDVKFRTKHKSGVSTQKITVKTNDPVNPTLRLEVKALLEVYFAASPRRLYYGRSKPVEPIVESLSFTGKEVDSIQITDVKMEKAERAENIQWKVHDNRDKDPKSFTMDVTLDPRSMKPGRFNENIIIKTDSEKVASVKVNISGDILGPISATPPRLYFGNYETGKSMSRTVKVESSENKTFRILKAELADKSLRVKTLDTSPKALHTLNIELDSKTKKDRFRTDLVITTDMKEHPEIIIPVNGYKKRERNTSRQAQIKKGKKKASTDRQSDPNSPESRRAPKREGLSSGSNSLSKSL